MDTDTFLHGLTGAARAAQWLVILAPFVLMLAMLGLFIVLIRRRLWMLAAGCLLLAVSPILGGYWTRRDAAYEHRELVADIRDRQALAARAAELAAFERQPLDGDYPPVLEIRGTLPKKVIRQLLRDGVFTEIHVYEQYRRRPDRRVVHTFLPTPDCRAFGRGHEERTGADHPYLHALRLCFPGVEERYVTVESPPDAVVYMIDGETTLGKPDGYHRGRLELRVRRGGDNQLVDYWEAPYVAPRSVIGRVEKARQPSPAAPEMDELMFIRRSLGLVEPAGVS